MVALGAGASGVFTRSQDIYNRMFDAAYQTGDRVWQMPMFNLYLTQMKKSPTEWVVQNNLILFFKNLIDDIARLLPRVV